MVESVEIDDEGQVVAAVRPHHREHDRCGVCGRRAAAGFDLGERRLPVQSAISTSPGPASWSGSTAFYVGGLRGAEGKVWQLTAIDIASSFGVDGVSADRRAIGRCRLSRGGTVSTFHSALGMLSVARFAVSWWRIGNTNRLVNPRTVADRERVRSSQLCPCTSQTTT